MSTTREPSQQTTFSIPPRLVEYVIAGVGLALFAGLLYYRLLFTNRVLASGDILSYFYPYRDFAAAALRQHHTPFWNPYIFLGAPFLANPQAAVFYPLHWPLSWLPVTKQLYWSAAVHTWLLGMGGYALMRHWRRSVAAAATTALVLAGSGFYGGLIGHINQMNGAAWLPWALLAVDAWPTGSSATGWRARLWNPAMLGRSAAFGVVVALMFTAGHTQTVYINLFGVGIWVVWPIFAGIRRWRSRSGWAEGWRITVPRTVIYAAGGLFGLLLSGVQLLPTLELSELGLRSGGLTYAETSSFSLMPFLLPWTLLPSYGLADLGVVFNTLGYTEYVAYIGLIGLVLAVLGAWRGRGTSRQFGLLFVFMGLFLAVGRWNPFYYLLYRIVPGFDLFRAPARWMMLYTIGGAVLAGLGAEVVIDSLRRRMTMQRRLLGLQPGVLIATGLLAVMALELLLAARSLPHTHPTAPLAVYDMRTAPAHLLTDPARSEIGPGAAGRFLSMSEIAFDPGDMADYQRILVDETGQLDQAAFDQLIVALKAQEILAPNLALLRRIPSVDGFDGGVLPLKQYLAALELFIPPDQLMKDGRLREQLSRMPDSRLLSLFNVQYIITDKVKDLWFDDVYYDRQIGARFAADGLDALSIEAPYPFSTTHVDLIGALDKTDVATVTQNTDVLHVTARNNGLPVGEWTVVAGPEPGAQLADGTLDSAMAASSGATVVYRDVEGNSQEYRVRLPLDAPANVDELVVSRVNGPNVIVQAATLYDERTGMFLALTPSDRGRFQRVHSGDVKIYENLDNLPRAYLVDSVLPAASDADALTQVQAMLSDPTFAPGDAAVVTKGRALVGGKATPGAVEILGYQNDSVELRTDSPDEGFVVLSDVNYPGWSATVDGTDTPVYAANHLLRGVYVPAGEHLVRFQYRPTHWTIALWMTASGLLLVSLALVMARLWSVRQEN